MSSDLFPRLREIWDLLVAKRGDDPAQQQRQHQFGGLFDGTPDDDHPVSLRGTKRKIFSHIEAVLAELDPGSWERLREHLVLWFARKDERRGWEQALNRLNEAKAYVYLFKLFRATPSFVPKSKGKTPDLMVEYDDELILCEVKTINRSDETVDKESSNDVLSVSRYLPEGFLVKLRRTLESSERQLEKFRKNNSRNVRKFVYFVVNFDDYSHEYAYEYMEQILVFLNRLHHNKIPEIDRIIFNVYPPFYTATSIGPPPQIYEYEPGDEDTWWFCSISPDMSGGSGSESV